MNNSLKLVCSKKYWMLSLAFLLYMYFYLTAELSFIDCVKMGIGKDFGTTFYGLFCFGVAAGFFAYAPVQRLFASTSLRRRILLGFGVVGAALTLLMPFLGGWIVGAASITSTFCAGYVGAALLQSMAVSVEERSAMGMLIAAPYATAFALQYLVGLVEPLFGDALLIVTHATLAVAFMGVALLYLFYESDANNKGAPRVANKTDTKKYLLTALVSCLIISCLYGLMDGIIMNLHAGQALDVWGGVRLLSIPGLLCAAWSFDYKEGKYFPFATLMSFVVEIIALFLFSTAETYNAALGSAYFLGSWMTLYSLAIFVSAARDAERADFWASAGRGVKYAAGGLFALAGGFLFEQISLTVIAILYVLLLVALACVFFLAGRLTIAPPDKADEKSSAPAPDMPTLEELTAAYRLTRRETEVLSLLIQGMTTAEIAETMVIAERSAQNYINSMLSKTSSRSRGKLVAKFTRQ